MTKQTKKLIAIFIVMVISTFAIIKAFGELKPAYEYLGNKYVESTELYETVEVPTDKIFVTMKNKEWAEFCENDFADRPNYKKFVKTKTLKAHKLKKDTLELLDTYGAFYVSYGPDNPDDEGIIFIRVWKARRSDKIYFKSVTYSPHKLELPEL